MAWKSSKTETNFINLTLTFIFQHVDFVNRMLYGFPPNEPMNGRAQNAPVLSSAFQRYYYDQSRHREDLLKSE